MASPRSVRNPRISYDNADRLTAITHTYVALIGFPTTTLATYTYAYNAALELALPRGV